MKYIKLNHNLFTIVDDEDYDLVNKWKWYCKRGYAVRSIYVNKKSKKVYLHRFLMNTPEGLSVDHINGNKLDNRKANLRNCTLQQNLCNRPVSKNKDSCKFKGVYRHESGKWLALIKKDGKRFHIGLFSEIKDAAKAYDKKAIELQGEFAHPNFI